MILVVEQRIASLEAEYKLLQAGVITLEPCARMDSATLATIYMMCLQKRIVTLRKEANEDRAAESGQ